MWPALLPRLLFDPTRTPYVPSCGAVKAAAYAAGHALDGIAGRAVHRQSGDTRSAPRIALPRPAAFYVATCVAFRRPPARHLLAARALAGYLRRRASATPATVQATALGRGRRFGLAFLQFLSLQARRGVER